MSYTEGGGNNGSPSASPSSSSSSSLSRDDEEEEEDVEHDELPSLVKLHEMVGLAELKERCANLRDTVALEQERGDDPKQKSLSVVLTGNPGTGKTSFAQTYGALLGELRGVAIPEGRVVRLTGAQLTEDGVKGLEEAFKVFDEPGSKALEVGDTVEVSE